MIKFWRYYIFLSFFMIDGIAFGTPFYKEGFFNYDALWEMNT